MLPCKIFLPSNKSENNVAYVFGFGSNGKTYSNSSIICTISFLEYGLTLAFTTKVGCLTLGAIAP